MNIKDKINPCSNSCLRQTQNKQIAIVYDGVVEYKINVSFKRYVGFVGCLLLLHRHRMPFRRHSKALTAMKWYFIYLLIFVILLSLHLSSNNKKKKKIFAFFMCLFMTVCFFFQCQSIFYFCHSVCRWEFECYLMLITEAKK